MSSPFAFKFLGKKPFTKKTVNPEAGVMPLEKERKSLALKPVVLITKLN
jgi:hypothetical protein